MKVKNPSGREYYIQRAKDDRMANWCSRVTPVILEFDGVAANAYADPDRSDWIYIRFNDTTYCHWAKEAGGFDLLGETSLQISDTGRTYRKRDRSEGDDDKGSSLNKDSDDRSLTREDLDAVVSYLPALREAVSARAADPTTNSHEYSSEFRSVVRQIVSEFHTRPFMYAFDYLSWMDEGRRLMDDPEGLAAADLETIRKLLVFHWRSDYWDTDNEHWEHIAASGRMTTLLERLEELSKDMAPSSERQDGSRMFIGESGDADKIAFTHGDEASGAIPDVAELTHAFERILPTLTEKQMTMLRAHYHSGGRAVTMRELATASGYGDYKIANLQYGTLAKKLLDAMERDAPLYNGKSPIAILVLGEIVDRDDFGLEMHLVMHDRVALVLERIGVVEPTGALGAENVDETEDIAGSAINDFIVYHNPDAMGPLDDDPTFEVFTSKSVSQAKAGDRVWLITGEDNPRKYYLACWFYIDEFASGEDEGFKHCIAGSKGQNFSPFVAIEQGEWFDQLKHDQGNFAFGFSRINTAGAVERFKTLAGSFEAAGSRFTALSLSDVEQVARFHSIIADVVKHVELNPEDANNGDVVSSFSKMEATLQMMNIFVEFDVEAWAEEGKRFSSNNEAIEAADLPIVRKLLSYHNHLSLKESGSYENRNLEYWIDLGMKGSLIAILSRLEAIHRAISDATIVTPELENVAGIPSSEAASGEEWTGTMTLLDIGEIGAWFGPLESAVAQHRASGSDGGSLDGLLQKLVQDLEDRDVFVDKDDINHWGTIAYVRAGGMEDLRARSREDMLASGFEELPADNVLALRRVLIVHKIRSEGRGYGNFERLGEEYWRDLAMKGELQKILQAFDTLSRNTARKTMVSGWMG